MPKTTPKQDEAKVPSTSRIRLNPDALYSIRLRQYSWFVSLGRDGKTFSKSFIFTAYESKESALAAAQAWRDDIVARHPPLSKLEKMRRPTAASVSGVSGVRISAFDAQGAPLRWIAKTQINGKIYTRVFSIAYWGYEVAREKAIEAREQQLTLVTGDLGRHPVLRKTPEKRGQVPLPLPPNEAKRRRVQRPRPGNTTGLVGVHLLRARDGRPTDWVATLNKKFPGEPGKNGVNRRVFSIRKYGDAQAKAMAIAAREEMVNKAYPLPRRSSASAASSPAPKKGKERGSASSGR